MLVEKLIRFAFLIVLLIGIGVSLCALKAAEGFFGTMATILPITVFLVSLSFFYDKYIELLKLRDHFKEELPRYHAHFEEELGSAYTRSDLERDIQWTVPDAWDALTSWRRPALASLSPGALRRRVIAWKKNVDRLVVVSRVRRDHTLLFKRRNEATGEFECDSACDRALLDARIDILCNEHKSIESIKRGGMKLRNEMLTIWEQHNPLETEPTPEPELEGEPEPEPEPTGPSEEELLAQESARKKAEAEAHWNAAKSRFRSDGQAKEMNEALVEQGLIELRKKLERQYGVELEN